MDKVVFHGARVDEDVVYMDTSAKQRQSTRKLLFGKHWKTVGRVLGGAIVECAEVYVKTWATQTNRI